MAAFVLAILSVLTMITACKSNPTSTHPAALHHESSSGVIPSSEITSSAVRSSSPAKASSSSAPSTIPSQSGASPAFSGAVAESAPVSIGYFSDAVFIGDSITSGLAIYHEIENSTIIAHDGLNTSSILQNDFYLLGKKQTVLSALMQSRYRKVYILLGANDIGFMSQNTFIKNYQEFINKLKEVSPGCTIYIQSIFPVTKDYELKTPSRANDKIDSYNEALLKMADENHICYLNVAQCLKDSENALPADQSGDGIHLNKSYYKKWIDYLTTHTAQTE